MIDTLLSPENLPFTAALGAMAMLAVLEALALLAGASLHGHFDAAIPDDIGGLSWLGFGKAPFIVVIASLATLFGILGLVIQSLSEAAGAGPLSPGLASFAALVAALPVTNRVSRALARFLPRDETYVGDRAKLIGSIGTIVQGTAMADLPAECRVPDGHGGSLYVQAVPDSDVDPIPEGTRVLIIRREDHHFAVVPFRD